MQSSWRVGLPWFFIGAILASALFMSASRLKERRSPPAFNSVDSTAALDLINDRITPPHSLRVLFIGDSLTMHGKVPQLWDHFSGMAATSPSNDFVHQTVAYMQSQIENRAVETFYDNGGNGKLGSIIDYLSLHPEISPDLLILQGGENDSFDASFRSRYDSLLKVSKRTVVLGDWFDDEKSHFERSTAAQLGFPFVDLRAIQIRPENSGYSGPYMVAGVARHPNDLGMKAISYAVSNAVQPYLKEIQKVTSNAAQ